MVALALINTFAVFTIIAYAIRHNAHERRIELAGKIVHAVFQQDSMTQAELRRQFEGEDIDLVVELLIVAKVIRRRRRNAAAVYVPLSEAVKLYGHRCDN